MRLSGPSTPVGVGDEFAVEVIVEPPGTAGVDGIEAYVEFDAAVLEVLEVVPSERMATVLSSTFDNQLGRVDHIAGTLGLLPKTTFTALTLRLRARAQTVGGTTVSLSTTAPRRSNLTLAGAYLQPSTGNAEIVVVDSAPPVEVVLLPVRNSFLVGEEVDVAIEVRAGERKVDGAAIYLDFDPSLLQVVSLTPGTALTEILERGFDNVQGRLGFAAGKFSQFPTGTFTLATVRFRGRAAALANLMPSFATGRRTDVTYAGRSLGVVAAPTALSILAPTTNVGLRLDPATLVVAGGESFDVRVLLDSGNQPVDGAAGFVDFDPAVLQVVRLTAGTVLPTVILERFDNQAGTIDFVAGSLAGLPRGNGLQVLTIRFQSRAATESSSIALARTARRLSDATYGGQSVLASVAGATISVGETEPGVWLEVVADPLVVAVGDEFDLVLRVRAGTQPVDGAAAFVEVDPSHVQMLALAPGTVLGTVLQNQLDPVAGVAVLVAGELGTLPAATFELGRIRARALRATDGTAVRLLEESRRRSDVTYGGASVLTEAVALDLPIAASGVRLLVQPQTPVARVGDVVEVSIDVEAGERRVDGVAAFVDFDPKVFALEGVTSSGRLPLQLFQRRDARGQLDFIVGTFGSYPTGTFPVASLRLRVIGAPVEGAARIDIVDVGRRHSDVTFGGLSILGERVAGEVEIAAGEAVVAVVPESEIVPTGRMFRVDLEVRAGSDPVDAAAAYVDFDPTRLRVLRVVSGSALPLEVATTIDNVAGRVDVVAGSLGVLPSGTFTLASLEMLAERATPSTPLQLQRTLPRRSDVAFAGASVLGGRESSQVTIAGPACFLDVDGSGGVAAADTDGKYLYRHLVGLPAVPESERAGATAHASDVAIAAVIDSLGELLDVDADGVVRAATDAVFINRLLDRHPQVVPADFGAVASPEANIIERIQALCCAPELGCTTTAADTVCVGDCGGNGSVSVEELIVGVSVALGTASMSQCAALDTNGDRQVTVEELLLASGQALFGCSGSGL